MSFVFCCVEAETSGCEYHDFQLLGALLAFSSLSIHTF